MIAKATTAGTSQAAALAAIGLEHPATEVQEEALSLLEKFGDPADPDLRASVVARRDLASPALRGRIDTWLGSGTKPSRTLAKDPQTAEVDGLSGMAAPLLSAAVALDDQIARRLEIPALLDELDAPQGTLRALDLTEAPRLAGRPRLDQVSTMGELIDLCLEAIERPYDGDLVERSLEGIARLAQERPSDFERRAAPLRNRLAKLDKGLTDASAAFEFPGERALGVVLKAWLTGELRSPALFEVGRDTYFL